MSSVESEKGMRPKDPIIKKTLLIVGPKPPPMGGSGLTLQAMIDEIAKYSSVQLALINTSPATDPRHKMTGFNFEKVWRSFSIVPKYMYHLRRSDAALVFANDLFAITIVPFLFFLARLFHKPFYLKPVGAGLDLFIKAQRKPIREYLLRILRAVDGILAQTRILRESLVCLGCTRTHYLPGLRPPAPMNRVRDESFEGLRLIFLAHITRRKGPLILLEALQMLAKTCGKRIHCDFFGPIHDEVREEFLEKLKFTPNAHYCGVAEFGTGSQLIAGYDALVLPTYFETEGHPGVLIEAMHAGVPVVTTQIRTISDLVTHEENGLLVPTQNSDALANAIKQLALDPTSRKRMGQANYQHGEEFRAETVVAKMIKIMFPEFANVHRAV